NVIAWDPENKSEVFLAKNVRLFVTIPDLGWLMMLVFAAVVAPLTLYILARVQQNESFIGVANRAVFISILLQSHALLFCILRVRDGSYPSLDGEGVSPTAFGTSPCILSGLVGGIFANLLYLLLLWRRQDLERLLPDT